MEITKLYKESTFEDLSNDKVKITMSMDEYLVLRNLISLARYKVINEEQVTSLDEKFNQADEKAKTKWV